MNIMIINCKQMTRIATSLLTNGGNFSRKYVTSVADYKITWVRPEKVSYLSSEKSGDQGLEIDVKSSDFAKTYNELPELKNASDIVKKMFTLQFLPRKETINVRRDKILELVQRHRLDKNSPEAIIAIMTNDIHQLQEDLTKCPKNKKMKVRLLETIAKRRKMLKYLRQWDYRRFEWILEKLNLVYKPLPELPHQITRKDSLRRLTEKHCNELVQEKLDIYKEELKKLQKDFYIEKAKKLAFIREEEITCGLQPSVSEEDIAYAKQKAIEYQT
ncbi:PREDICTED: 28S ribosomal protein S15, mitochondrial [Trachymyrmex septentrionalis]|uniref:28S ribosomal protein S15, mitochondrial n=1 Tax=Trachymyrmex septentrionalis TaxID=34720 RepID=UPI00084F4B09|nr:PREDICTED: 28S ribosomal protein S15, mitochondrial [Trachymyrmex septentrionalis]